MTGFGDASAQHDGAHFAVEVRALNNRYFKAAVRLPEELLSLEAELEAEIRKRVSRGSVTLTVHYKDTSAHAAYEINEAALKAYLQHLTAIENEVNAASGGGRQVEIDLASMLALPGVVQPPDHAELLDRCRPIVRRLLDQACAKMLAMREQEGRTLVDDLQTQRAFIVERLTGVEQRAPAVVDEYHLRLRQRVDELMAKAKLKLGENDLIREVAIYAERCDISEEISRLKAHLQLLDHVLSTDDDEPTGRKLDFIAQELLREANTIGSKSNDAQIARTVVEIKGAIDRIKEQVQNVE